MEDILGAIRAVGERTRLRILFLLSHGELTITELTLILNQSQPRVSRHVKVLSDAAVVERIREGSWVFLRLSEKGRAAALSHAIVDIISAEDEVARNDLSRLERIREARALKAMRYFESNAENWDKIRSLHTSETDVEKLMLEIIGDDQVSNYLDIGTGTGRILELIAQNAKRAVGIDMSHEMLAIARNKMETAGHSHVQVRHGDLYTLPLDDASIDLITIHQVLHFLDDPAAAIAEARRVLMPGGRIVIVDFAPHDLEFLREEQAHHRLGIKQDQMHDWAIETHLVISRHETLPPDFDIDRGLTVSLWLLEAPFRDPDVYAEGATSQAVHT